MANLIGRKTQAGWEVVGKVNFPPDQTGGHFSECFYVEKDGIRAFMKVIDLSVYKDIGSVLTGLSGFDYETRLVSHTTSAGLSRVVRLLESGSIVVDAANPVAFLRSLPYLVFERGEGDIRKTVDVSKHVDDRWRFCVLQRAAAALMQLHQTNIAHQDLKPSNVIRISGDNLKLGDLGRSSMRGAAAPHDVLDTPGALAYSPFELTYSFLLPDWVQRRLATDVFHLGCLMVFVFTNVVLPAAVISRLDTAYRPEKWGDSYEGVVPHIQAALSEVVQEISADFPPLFREELVNLVLDLCNPIPLLRGSAHGAASQAGTVLWLQKFVSRLNLLEKRAAVLAKK